jgi:pimeloyl-ACP methyl ester carboxylesterase
MPVLDSDIGPIHYTDQGQGDAVVLLHGFAATADENWNRSGWISMLVRDRRRVVTLDLRGHGLSARSHDPAQYSAAAMAGDVIALVEALALKKPDLIGFSLGARVALEALWRAPERFLLGVLCGAGGRWLSPPERDPEILPQAFEADRPEDVHDEEARRFRLFADAQDQDRLALAAVARGLAASSKPLDPAGLAAIANEVLVIAGRNDVLAGDPYPLASALGRGSSTVIPWCGHMDCLVQPMFKGAVMDFLAGQPQA